MTTTLKYTPGQARDRAQALIGIVGIPNKWWPYSYGEDCLAYVLYVLGVRTRSQTELKYISISAFLETFVDTGLWEKIPASEVRSGDIAVENWPGTGLHVELVYSGSGVTGKTLTTDAADTGPAPGVDEPRGAWHKSRTVGSWLEFGIRPPYKSGVAATTSSQRVQWRQAATWLNQPQHLPTGCRPSGVGDYITGGKTIVGDGITDPAPIWWTNVQTWGSLHNAHGSTVTRAQSLYTAGYEIDGVPGTQSEKVADVISTLAKAAAKS